MSRSTPTRSSCRILTNRSKYPPKDPTVGGAMALLSRVFPMDVTDLSGLVQPLPDGGVVPGLPDWHWYFTPGHAPGHVSYFCLARALLLAGDTFTTVNLNSFVDIVVKKPEISLPPPPFTCDWEAARKSVALMARPKPANYRLRPRTSPERLRHVASDLHRFSAAFTPPRHGRYVGSPAETDLNGIVSLPPPAPDLFPVQVAAVARGCRRRVCAVAGGRISCETKTSTVRRTGTGSAGLLWNESRSATLTQE